MAFFKVTKCLCIVATLCNAKRLKSLVHNKRVFEFNTMFIVVIDPFTVN